MRATADEEVIAGTLHDICPYLFGDSALDAFELARALQFASYRLRAFRALKSRLSGPALSACIDQIFQTLEAVSPTDRSSTLISMREFGHGPRARDVIVLTWSIWDDEAREAVLRWLPNHDRAAWAAETIGRARLVREPAARIRALGSLVRHVSRPQGVAVFQEAFRLALAIPSTRERIEALRVLWLCGVGREVAFAALTTAVRALDSPSASEFFISLSQTLSASDDERLGLLEEAWRCARDVDLDHEALERLDALWPRLSGPVAMTVWDWSWSLRKADLRRRVQSLLNNEWYKAPEERAFISARSIVEPVQRFIALWDIARALWSSLPHKAWTLLLDSVVEIGDAAARLEAFKEVVADAPPPVLLVALKDTGFCADSTIFDSILDRISHSDNPAPPSQLFDAIATASDSAIQCRLVITFARFLLPDYSEPLVKIVLATNNTSTVRAHLALLPLLRESNQLTVVSSVVSFVASANCRLQDWDLVRQALRRWVVTHRLIAHSYWESLADQLSGSGRPIALRSLGVLMPLVDTDGQYLGRKIAMAVKDICRWWP